MCLLGIIAIAGVYFSLRSELPSVAVLKDLKWQTPMQIYSADGKLISQFGEKKRIPLTLEQMPKQLINALLATEDDRFYLHFGVDPIGMGRAILGQLTGHNRGGASTITMQVARNFFLTRERTAIRKIREIFLSFHIESLLTKDEILMLYMNKIELGHRAFGFGAAAQVYYGKDVKELTLAQMAVLAGLPKAPSTLNPISYPERAKKRRSVVLQRMLSQGYITQTEYNQANNAPITASKHGAEIELNAPYIAEMAHQEMLNRYGKEDAYTSGYKVFTTVSSKLQNAAKQALITNVLNYDKRHGFRGPIKNIVSTDAIEQSSVKDDNSVNTSTVVSFDNEAIKAALKNIQAFYPLMPAVVTAVSETDAQISYLTDADNINIGHIDWPNMAWARPFISDNKQGMAPKLATEILTVGDIVYVEKTQINNEFMLSQLPEVSSALVSLNPDDGAIEALVGGFSFEQSQYNRATQAKRQVGSNIKPFIYSAALENGFTLASIVNDAPINQWDKRSGVVWRPKNSPPTYVGPLRVRLGLAQSKNVISVRLLRKVGLSKIIDHLAQFGFNPTELPHNESLALGSASLTPIEVATGFATFANGGFLIKPYLISRIENSNGDIIFQANPALAKNAQVTSEEDNFFTPLSEKTTYENVAPRAISKQNAFLISQALNSVIWGADWSVSPGWQGTGFRARVLKRRDIAGKTGTTNEAKDAWFSGFSRRIVATSWIGFDDHSRNLGQTSYNRNLTNNQITGKEFGAKSAQPAWISFMKTALADLPFEPFIQPEGIVSVRIDKQTGKLTNKTDNSSTFEYFMAGTEPTEYVTQDHSTEIFDQHKPKQISPEAPETEIF
jgi:penicillin-binding protein 1A